MVPRFAMQENLASRPRHGKGWPWGFINKGLHHSGQLPGGTCHLHVDLQQLVVQSNCTLSMCVHGPVLVNQGCSTDRIL
jgi:hypothetical protein